MSLPHAAAAHFLGGPRHLPTVGDERFFFIIGRIVRSFIGSQELVGNAADHAIRSSTWHMRALANEERDHVG
jgi:hypothetical protein